MEFGADQSHTFVPCGLFSTRSSQRDRFHGWLHLRPNHYGSHAEVVSLAAVSLAARLTAHLGIAQEAGRTRWTEEEGRVQRGTW